MADINTPTQLNLGRVSTAVSAVRSVAPMLTQENSAVTGLLNIGKTIAGAAVKAQMKKEFYEGQDKILQASLAGTQKEELQNILEDQPYYMQILGAGATAEGAVEMASRVGAGKLFDTNLARLANGQDADIDPDTYRENVQAQIAAQRTGNEQVDSVFMPQMIVKGQGLIATHLTKHLEYNSRNAYMNSVNATVAGIEGLQSVVKAESQDPKATFVEGTPPDLMLPATKAAYQRVVSDFDPASRPLNVDEAKWITSKIETAIPALKLGHTGVYQAIRDSGLYARMPAAERVKLDDAREQGKRENDSHNQMNFMGEEDKLFDMVFNATDTKDAFNVLRKASEVQGMYIKAGITPPDNFKDDTAIKAWYAKAKGNVDEYLKAQTRKNERLSAVTAARMVDEQEEDKFMVGILNNALGDNPTGEVLLTTADGNSGRIAPTPEDRNKAFIRQKNQLMSLSEQERQSWLDLNGLKSVEGLAYKLQVVDEATQGRVTQLLRMTSGVSSTGLVEVKGKPNANAERIGKAMALIDNLSASLPRDGVAEYIKDEGLRKDLNIYLDAVATTGDVMGAWESSFGKDKSVAVTYVAKDLDNAMKSGDVKDAIKSAGIDSLAVTGWVRQEAVRNMESRHAQEPKEAVRQALASLNTHSEFVGDTRVLGVPQQFRIGTRIGIRNNTTVSKLTDTYIKSTLPYDYSYAIDFDPRTQTHVVVPQNRDGAYIWSQARPLDYKAIKGLANNTKALEEAQKKVKPKGGFGNASDDQVYPL